MPGEVTAGEGEGGAEGVGGPLAPLLPRGSLPRGVAAKGHRLSPNWENKAALNRRSRVGEAVGLGGLPGQFPQGPGSLYCPGPKGKGRGDTSAQVSGREASGRKELGGLW